MTNDAYEARDLVADRPDIAAHCRQLMDEWVSEQMKKPNWSTDPLNEVLRERGIKKGHLVARN
ncbi:MAG: hypothetical protein HN742_19490 [Lentisphaerae bacterium]|nr:hypothetical protein [Lentisphaerota bacterium]MBT4815751.1 hypothetical protein [Lentisphaerota bacterium]MBT5605708.1 hypothetical protein [Lentisphaerota bacterium]MBT7055437.1 hypothetical protein [Lentisphaerota bacterium]MBT7844073.1 hypothetical protein [Lentisphaerota bacterium]